MLWSLEHTIGCCSVTRTAVAKKLGWSQRFSPQIATYFSGCRQKQTGPIDIKWEKLCFFFFCHSAGFGQNAAEHLLPEQMCFHQNVVQHNQRQTDTQCLDMARGAVSIWGLLNVSTLQQSKIVVHRSCCSVTRQQLSGNKKFIRSVLSLWQASLGANTVSLTWKDTSLLPGIVHKDKCFYNKPYTL